MQLSNDNFDRELRLAILENLAQYPQTAHLCLRVGVLNGIAHLTGKAPSLELWVMAADVAESIAGVRGVVNRIEAPGAPNPSRPINLQLDKNKKQKK